MLDGAKHQLIQVTGGRPCRYSFNRGSWLMCFLPRMTQPENLVCWEQPRIQRIFGNRENLKGKPCDTMPWMMLGGETTAEIWAQWNCPQCVPHHAPPTNKFVEYAYPALIPVSLVVNQLIYVHMASVCLAQWAMASLRWKHIFKDKSWLGYETICIYTP